MNPASKHLPMNRSTSFLLSIILPVVIFSTVNSFAQSSDPGRLSGGFETNTILYADDIVSAPEDRLGTNNYLKVDYSRGRFTAGGQYEFYGPVLQGFDPTYQGGRLVNKFASWTDDNFSVTVGDFYEQFGSGLILRSYEDRALGFNNSLEGVRVTYRVGDIFAVRALAGRPRMGMGYTSSWVRGIDASLSLASLLGISGSYLALEGSFINRYERVPLGGDELTGPNMDAWSGRLVVDLDAGFSLRAEYVEKGKDVYLNSETFENEALGGNAQLLEMSYNNNGLGIFATFRRLDHMDIKLTNNSQSTINILNYLPSLTRQYTYLLTNLRPYAAEAVGEQGGQLDVFYNFRRGTALGGKYGMKIHVNGSAFFPLEKTNDKLNLLFSDISLDIEKQWDRKLKTTLLLSVQQYSPTHGRSPELWVSNIVVADVLYKFTRRHSLRAEVQYLFSKEDSRDWVAVLAEYSFAPRWSVFLSDMYNHGSTRIHYYNAGFSYSQSRTRIALSYGRNREGVVCSGGVCRFMPAYTGANLVITTSF